MYNVIEKNYINSLNIIYVLQYIYTCIYAYMFYYISFENFQLTKYICDWIIWIINIECELFMTEATMIVHKLSNLTVWFEVKYLSLT